MIRLLYRDSYSSIGHIIRTKNALGFTLLNQLIGIHKLKSTNNNERSAHTILDARQVDGYKGLFLENKIESF